MRLRTLVPVAVGVWIGIAPGAAAELPIRSVVLYKHGVGYFERAGTLGSGQSASLDFKTEEMNDVLKSLTITDNAGKVTGVRYDSNIPLERKLGEFPFHLGDGEPLSAVFDQLKGARIEMELGTQKVSGSIVAARLVAADKEHPEREQLTLLLDSGELHIYDLAAATGIRFSDPKLQLQFRDYLAALGAARSKDKRSVYIDSTDSKSRDVRASYIMPMPAWKSSYRLLFDSSAQPTLEGWAIVDNTTGDDWTNVRMSLVSGKPISFISNLYDPKYISRMSAQLAEDQAVAPTVYSGAVKQDAEPKAMAFARGGGGGGGMSGSGGGLGPGVIGGVPMGAPGPRPMMAAESSVVISGPAEEIADLFEYSVKNPVTVKKNESTMIPFLQQKVTARKLIIYSDGGKPNPLNAAELTNATGQTLDGGPITIYDGGTYAGEALTETIKTSDKRFISYGVDLGTRITSNLDSRSDDVRELHVHNGILITRSALIHKHVYSTRNVDARAKTLIIEFPVRPGFTLIDTVKPLEAAHDVYRFEVKVPASGSIDFPITEENVYDQQTSVSSITPDQLLVYVRNKSLSDNSRRQLQQVAELKTKIAAGDSEKRRTDADVQNISRDEERNRLNIQSLSSVSGQQQVVQDYARKLSGQEAQIATLRDRQAQLDTEKVSLQTQLNTLIDQLNF